jgi:large subunit ribosomal protein L1
MRIKEDSAKKKRLAEKSARIGEPENIFDVEKLEETPKQTGAETQVPKEGSEATIAVESGDTPTEEVKVPRKPKVKSKKYKEAKALVEKNKSYPIDEAIEIIQKASYSKFPGTIELHLTLADKELRGTLALPHGSGKTVKVLAFVPDAKIKDATEAGATYAGGQQIADQIKKNEIVPGRDFNAVVADPSAMPVLAPLARVLGPKGLMPNPKTNTVGTNIAQLVANLVKGQVTYKAETPNPYLVHMPMGKVTFTKEQLTENYNTIIQNFGTSKVKKVTLSATMSPGVQVTL